MSGIPNETVGTGMAVSQPSPSPISNAKQRRSPWFALSLLCNAGLLLYAHVGLSAVILSNQRRISESTSSGSNSGGSNNSGAGSSNSTNATEPGSSSGACVASDIERWTTGGGALNKSRESNHCARLYTSPISGGLCLLDVECSAECMSTVFGYTLPCASCFGEIPACSLNDGCAVVCQLNDGTSDECQACTVNCNANFATCSGLDLSYTLVDSSDNNATNGTANNIDTENNETIAGDAETSSPSSSSSTLESSAQVCNRQQVGMDVLLDNPRTVYHVVYEIQFLAAIKTAWTSNAPWLAIVVAVFSGVWPYIKLLILGVVYYFYLNDNQDESRARMGTLICRWLRRWGKYTFVDIYVIILILVGVALPIVVAGNVPVIIKGEPQGAIVAFLFATLWSFVQLEWILHERKVNDESLEEVGCETARHPKEIAAGAVAVGNDEVLADGDAEDPSPRVEKEGATNNDINDTKEVMETAMVTTVTARTEFTAQGVMDGFRFSSYSNKTDSNDVELKAFANPPLARLGMQLLLVLAIGLLVAGSFMEFIRFSSILGGETVGCDRSYNVYTLGTALLSDFQLTSSDGAARFGLWILCVTHWLFIGIIPFFVHAVHVVFFLLQVPLLPEWLFSATNVAWTFASIEVLLLAVFALQRKFDELIAALAGNDGSQFFGIESQLGPGFYLLIAYCFVGGMSQYLLNSALQQHMHPSDILHRGDYIWTKLLGCLLVDERRAVATRKEDDANS